MITYNEQRRIKTKATQKMKHIIKPEEELKHKNKARMVCERKKS